MGLGRLPGDQERLDRPVSVPTPSPGTLTISSAVDDGTICISLAGELDLAGAGQIEDRLRPPNCSALSAWWSTSGAWRSSTPPACGCCCRPTRARANGAASWCCGPGTLGAAGLRGDGRARRPALRGAGVAPRFQGSRVRGASEVGFSGFTGFSPTSPPLSDTSEPTLSTSSVLPQPTSGPGPRSAAAGGTGESAGAGRWRGRSRACARWCCSRRRWRSCSTRPSAARR